VTNQKDLSSFLPLAWYTHFKLKTASEKLKLEEEIGGRRTDYGQNADNSVFSLWENALKIKALFCNFNDYQMKIKINKVKQKFKMLKRYF
jgi:hypothetical protein